MAAARIAIRSERGGSAAEGERPFPDRGEARRLYDVAMTRARQTRGLEYEVEPGVGTRLGNGAIPSRTAITVSQAFRSSPNMSGQAISALWWTR